jgi:hypothetical protein
MRASFCDGVSRRDLLRVGAAGALTLPTLLSAGADDSGAARAKSLIFVFLHGGMSHHDTFDLKPDAPAEIRGEFKPIPTTVPGIRICEHLPKMAGQADKYALIRSFRHHNSDHGPADHYMLTGYFPAAGFNPTANPNNLFPAHGAVVARALGPRGAVPPYVMLPKMHPSAGPAYLGPGSAPFVIEADPNAPNFSVPDLVPPSAIAADRLGDRKALLTAVDRFQRSAEVRANRDAGAVGTFREKAFALMTSPAAKAAFDLQAEPPKLRDEYGRTTLGQSCLMARRLVEAGVRCVTIDHSNWDTHDGNFAVLKNTLLPAFDPALATLFRDLADRGLLASTLVVVTGEFGRTPRINKNAGRDHWGPAFTVLMAGGGVRGGRAVGQSDGKGERPAGEAFGPEDLAATAYTLLGINPRDEFRTPDGRPVAIVNNGKIMHDLL